MSLKHVLRRLFRTPMFTVITVATLALGIGANSAIFSVVEGILLKPLPYPDSQNLVAVSHSIPGINFMNAGTAPFLHFSYRDEARSFEQIGMFAGDSVSVTGLAEPEQVEALNVTKSTLETLGVPPMAGRGFSAKDDSPGSPRTVILTHGYWKLRFGGDASIVGRKTITLNGTPREIIGVMPENFRFLDRKPAVIIPMQLDEGKTLLGNFSYQGLARLKPGVTIAQATADLARVIPISLQKYPPPSGFSLKMFSEVGLAPSVKPLKQDLVGDVGNVLWVLMGTIGMVLLIACANVANLLLVRADGRQQELAIRAALGAGWTRIARELLLESVTLGVVGGLLGLAFAYGALRLLVAMAPANLPRLNEISIDGVVLLFTFAVSILAGVLFGLLPILKYAGPHLGVALRAGGRTLSQSKERHRTRSAMVVVQIALALVLLVSSGLMIRTFQALKNVKPGFTNPQELQTLRISIPQSQVRDAEPVMRMEQAIMDKIASVPGVSSVGLVSYLPMDGGGWTDPIFAEDHVYAEAQVPPLRRYKFISPGLLKTMGNTLAAGRDFTWTDVYDKRHVALVSENLARELWKDPASAIGKRIRENSNGQWREIIGVVSDERDNGVDKKAPPIAFWPIMTADFGGNQTLVIRGVAYVIRSSRTGAESFLNEVKQAVWSVNPNLPLARVRTLQEIYDKSMARTSFTMVMLAIAGAMALLIGVVGIYGVISYSVAQRTREIGIRMALGAQKEELTRMFVGHGLVLAAIGAGCGLIVAFGLMRVMSSLLFDVKPVDPLTYSAVAIGLIAATALASYVPALRATMVDPVEALRAE